MTFLYLQTPSFLLSLPFRLFLPAPPSSKSLDIDDHSLMLLAVLPSHDPVAIPRGNGRKRSRGSFSRNHKPSLHPRERAEGRNVSIVTSTDLRPTTRRPSPPTCQQPQSRQVSHRRRKRRRFSTNGTGLLQNHLPGATSSHCSKPVFPTAPPLPSSSFPTLPPSSSQTDEDRESVISERLRLKMSKCSSTTARGSYPAGHVCTYEDWQDIKELFAKAAEQYNGKHVPNIFKHLFFALPSMTDA